MCVETNEIIILKLGEIQEDESGDIERELKIELTDISAIFYLDNKLIGSFDIEYIWTFKDKLTKILDRFDEGG